MIRFHQRFVTLPETEEDGGAPFNPEILSTHVEMSSDWVIVHPYGTWTETTSPAEALASILGPWYLDIDSEEIALMARAEWGLAHLAWWTSPDGHPRAVMKGQPSPNGTLEIDPSTDRSLLYSIGQLDWYDIYERNFPTVTERSCAGCRYWKEFRCQQYHAPRCGDDGETCSGFAPQGEHSVFVTVRA